VREECLRSACGVRVECLRNSLFGGLPPKAFFYLLYGFFGYVMLIC
jgi:hypothetical protein